MSKFGIDLGTTYSSIGWYNPETHQVQVAMLDSAIAAAHLLPSAVYVESPGHIVVGQSAVNAGHEKPERCLRWFKRELGNPTARWEIDGTVWTPLECSAKILETLKKEAEVYFSTEVKDVVITFPAFFQPEQKELTWEAARMAGLNVIRMIEEPQAAALAYVIEEVLKQAKDQSKEVKDLVDIVPQILERLAGEGKAVLVYDLGGGTFDVALAQFSGKPTEEGTTELHVKTLCNDGDIFLGGKNWDEEIIKLAEAADIEAYSHNFKDDPQAGRMEDICEQAKKDLSKLEEVTILCTSNHSIKLTRQAVVERTANLVDKTRIVMSNILVRAANESGVPKEGITLLLNGGMCRWPAVREMVTKLMDDKTPIVPKNLDLMVTYGAAYLAYLTVTVEERTQAGTTGGTSALGPEAAIPPSLPVSGTGTSLIMPEDSIQASYPAIGIEVLDSIDKKKVYVSRIIPTGCTVGEKYEQNYATPFDNQTEVEIKISYLKEKEGHKDDETDLSAWKEYKAFRMTGLSPKPAGQPIYVSLGYVAGGGIEGRAHDGEGNEVQISTKIIVK